MLLDLSSASVDVHANTTPILDSGVRLSPGDIVGRTLAGKYQVRRLLGEGGMGFVVEAEDLGLERSVAIKFLQPEYTCHGEARERFLREARAAAKIHSEYVARVIDVNVTQQGTPYMVMEYLEGLDLCQLLKREGHLSIESACLYLTQACEPLAEAHTQGIVHRDLKPANLFLECHAGGAYRVKLLDFGISKTLAPAHADMALTRTSASMGSPLYMSPEQMRSSRDVDCRTDVWALGVILYEALSGQVPFEGGSVPEVAAQILLEQPRDLLQAAPWVPTALAECVMRALAKEPDERLATVGEFAQAIAPFAPSEAQTTLERIDRILNAGGLLGVPRLGSSADSGSAPFFPGSTAPTRLDSGPGDPETNFGKTRGPKSMARRRAGGVRWAVALGGGLSVVFAVVLTAQGPLPGHASSGVTAGLEPDALGAGRGLPPEPNAGLQLPSQPRVPAQAGLPAALSLAHPEASGLVGPLPGEVLPAVQPVGPAPPPAIDAAPGLVAAASESASPAEKKSEAEAEPKQAKPAASKARKRRRRVRSKNKSVGRRRAASRRGATRPAVAEKQRKATAPAKGASSGAGSSAPKASRPSGGAFTSRFGTRK